jgi:hypothetical protein
MSHAGDLSRSIIEFLRNSSIPKINQCHGCGALMEFVLVTLSFDGQQSDIGLPICPVVRT